jgi:NAD(P)-dependent dehydrogenase (short-subunit alcohol dehydrogenase family)
MRLDGQAAIVTGGASGLGAATAMALAKHGAKVAVIDLNLAAAEAIAKSIGGIGIGCDVANAEAAEAAFATAASAHGGARVLVNCAGVGTAGRIVGRDGPMKLEAFERVIRINLIGTFNMLRLAAAEMATLAPEDDGERGIIVNTASIAGIEGQIGQAAYAASKAGVIGLTIQAARELARSGIRVMTIAPGLIQTPMFNGLPEDVRQSLAATVPFPPRLGLPDEYAALVLHIIANRFLNGETIRLDGALRMAPR